MTAQSAEDTYYRFRQEGLGRWDSAKLAVQSGLTEGLIWGTAQLTGLGGLLKAAQQPVKSFVFGDAHDPALTRRLLELLLLHKFLAQLIPYKLHYNDTIVVFESMLELIEYLQYQK